VRAAGERLDVQRLRVLPVDPVANAAQTREVVRCCSAGLPVIDEIVPRRPQGSVG
jgi:hypothetical protein